MTGAFPAIVGAILALLQAAPAVSANVYANRMRPLADGQNDGVAVRLVSAPADEGGIQGGPIEWDTRVAIECYVRSDSDENALQAAHDLANACWSRIAADTTLGGLAMGIRFDGLEWDFDATADFLACQTINLTVLHQTAANNLETRP